MAGRPTVPRPSSGLRDGRALQRPYATHQEPLEDRIDAAGKRQLEDPAEAKRLRAIAFDAGEEDAAGWWKHDGVGGWAYHGNDAAPSRRPQ